METKGIQQRAGGEELREAPAEAAEGRVSDPKGLEADALAASPRGEALMARMDATALAPTRWSPPRGPSTLDRLKGWVSGLFAPKAPLPVISRCTICGRVLVSRRAIARGMGGKCAAKQGLHKALERAGQERLPL